MKFGISTLSRGIYTSRNAYKRVAVSAEKAGFDFMSVNDHLIVPAKLDSASPARPSETPVEIAQASRAGVVGALERPTAMRRFFESVARLEAGQTQDDHRLGQ